MRKSCERMDNEKKELILHYPKIMPIAISLSSCNLALLNTFYLHQINALHTISYNAQTIIILYNGKGLMFRRVVVKSAQHQMVY
jgi:hypothetical protein